MNTAPAPTAKEREKLQARVNHAMENDPIDGLLEGYRPLSVDDVLRFDVHWYHGWADFLPHKGEVVPLFRTNRVRKTPLRVLRGFLYRLERGMAKPETDPNNWLHVKRPGHAVVYNVHRWNGLVGEPDCIGNLPWKPHALRKSGGMTAGSLDTVYKTWGGAGNNTGFYDGPSGPYLWERPDGRFITADNDAWGDPALIDLVWRTEPS